MKYLLFFLAIAGIIINGQFELDKERSTLQITGTSSLHDWTMDVTEFDASGIITDSEVQNLQVIVKSKSMKSGKDIMDQKTYKAVQAETYPDIIFQAETLEISGEVIRGKGTLEIATKTRDINFTAQILSDDVQEMHLSGEAPMKMTDFDIAPPTAIFGTLKTGDEVVIKFDIFLTK